VLYGTARFVAEFWRAPDIQLGFVCCGWMTMGQLLSLLMIAAGLVGYALLKRRGRPVTSRFSRASRSS